MSVCAAKVRTALLEKALDCEFIHLDLRAGDAQKPDYLKLNPNAVVPTLVHDHNVLIESTVICEFIDDEWPDPPLKLMIASDVHACVCGQSNSTKGCTPPSDRSRLPLRFVTKCWRGLKKIKSGGWPASRSRTAAIGCNRFSNWDYNRLFRSGSEAVRTALRRF
jgi:Glutathione S-transferase, N-terminal domain